MFFLPDQVNEYDEKRAHMELDTQQLSFVVTDEKNAIAWLNYVLRDGPKTYQEIQPMYLQELHQSKQEKMPELLDMLDVKGSTVTADAMSCQRAIAAQIRQGGADYVLALKGNQPALLEDVKFYFESERVASHKTNDKDHGRIESREYFLETDISWLTQRADWAGLQGIGMVRSTVIQKKNGELREDCRYFLTSLTDIEAFAHAVRQHWSIENQLHWQLDVVFREDACRARQDNSPLNLNIIRKEALHLLKQADIGKRVSLRRKMAKAAMNNDSLSAIFAQK